MKTKRIVLGTLAGGVTMFLLGWLIYGIIMTKIMEDETLTKDYMRAEADWIWWSLAASNFVWALLLALIIDWTANYSVAHGVKVAATIGFLAGLAFDLNMYAMTTFFDSFSFIIGDALAYSLLFALTGAVIALVMNKAGVKRAL